LRFPSSTKVPRHTRAISSSLPTSSPGRSTRAVKISSARLPHAQGYRLRAEVAVSEPGGTGRTRSRVRTRRDRSLEPRSIRRVRTRRHPTARWSESAYTAESGHERSTTIEQRSDDLRQRVYNLVGSKGHNLALKRPTVAPAMGPLTEAVLKHVCVVPNRRP